MAQGQAAGAGAYTPKTAEQLEQILQKVQLLVKDGEQDQAVGDLAKQYTELLGKGGMASLTPTALAELDEQVADAHIEERLQAKEMQRKYSANIGNDMTKSQAEQDEASKQREALVVGHSLKVTSKSDDKEAQDANKKAKRFAGGSWWFRLILMAFLKSKKDPVMNAYQKMASELEKGDSDVRISSVTRSKDGEISVNFSTKNGALLSADSPEAQQVRNLVEDRLRVQEGISVTTNAFSVTRNPAEQVRLGQNDTVDEQVRMTGPSAQPSAPASGLTLPHNKGLNPALDPSNPALN